MRISVRVSGHYDWASAPPGTVITEGDVKALRAKQMVNAAASEDGHPQWSIRIEHKHDEPTWHDNGLHESELCDRMAAIEKFHGSMTREDAVVEALKLQFRHHIAPKHMIELHVDDDGPNESVYRAKLEALEIVGAEQDALVTVYMDSLQGKDLEAYLNTVFRTTASKGI